MRRLLVIDDRPEISALVLAVAKPLGYVSEQASTFVQFRSLLELGGDPDVIEVDLVMPEVDGIEVLRFLGERQCRAGILLLSNSDQRLLMIAEEMAIAMGLRTIGAMRKPFTAAALKATLQHEWDVRVPDLLNPPAAPLVTVEALRRAVVEKQFVLHYQPQVDIKTGVVAGLELLVRWQHPEHGLLFPDAFISLCESSGIIDDMTWLVVDQAFKDNKLFAAQRWKPTLSINVSALSLCDLKLPDILLARAEAAGVAPARIILEITESGLVKNAATVLDILARLRLRGINLSIDDFGTGFSMMHQLKRIPANELKIDREFVRLMVHDRDAEVIVRKTIEIGHELGMKVIAEGVENPAQLQMLSSLNCDLAQGYLFARPMPVNAILAWRETHRHSEAGASMGKVVRADFSRRTGSGAIATDRTG